MRIWGAAALIALAGGAAAQEHEGHGAMGAQMPAAMHGYMQAMDGMMAAMPQESTGNADADFLLMIPHHQSAIDMAEVVLAEGADPEVRALAEEIIAAQEEEIAAMRAMLEAMGVEGPAG
jgi:uncharacterized protein (DUF305 family)